METLIGTHWHDLPREEVAALLKSETEKGLDILEVRARQEHFGLNLLARRKGRGPLSRFLLQFSQPLVIILIAASIVTGIVVQWSDAGVIFAVVLINAIIF